MQYLFAIVFARRKQSLTHYNFTLKLKQQSSLPLRYTGGWLSLIIINFNILLLNTRTRKDKTKT